MTELLLAVPEGQWYDRKSARIAARDLGKTLVAMANAEGGTIAIGLFDGRCEGVDDSHPPRTSGGRPGSTIPNRRCVSMSSSCHASTIAELAIIYF